ncbi:hypothetical protein, partial [Janthinobacterium sp.]|uniref:hypothetical protein n=1 Tax=Janthinobacterium sp. TaxID=1871054 RepID=UPI00260BB5B6
AGEDLPEEQLKRQLDEQRRLNEKKADSSNQNGKGNGDKPKHGKGDEYVRRNPLPGYNLATNILLAGAGTERIATGSAVKAAESLSKPAIGATGKVGEDALKLLGGDSQVYFRTSQGGRYIDQLVNGIGHESKVGYTSLTADIRVQIAKDVGLMATKQIRGSTWNFFTSPVTEIIAMHLHRLRDIVLKGTEALIFFQHIPLPLLTTDDHETAPGKVQIRWHAGQKQARQALCIDAWRMAVQ